MPIVSASALGGTFDVCIVGAGPAGLSCAFACHERGLRVLLLDAGGRRPVPGEPDLLAAKFAETNGHAHDPIEIVAAAALGGSSHGWGGRSVPLDPVDMRGWPITWLDLLPWWTRAAELIGAGSVLERPAPGKFAALERFHATHSESWAPDPILSRLWRSRIAAREGPNILLGARVTGIRHAGARVTGLQIQTAEGVRRISAGHFVLAAGGLGGMKLLLLAQRNDPSLFGGPDGPLGRGYMGHVAGSIADLVFDDPQNVAAFRAYAATGNYVARRRILPKAETVVEQGIGNIAFWIGNPELGDPSHGSAGASAKFLAASGVRMLAGKSAGSAAALSAHFRNVRRAPLAAAAGLASAAWTLATTRLLKQRYLPRAPLSAGGNGWRLVYHSEQKSDPRNRVTLSDEQDSLGLPKLHIDFRFHDHDVRSVVRAHDLLDDDLRKAGAGRLRWTAAGAREEVVMSKARDGYHQIGGTAMSTDPASGVVDRDCRVHGFDNLWIASSSVFPTSGQANPTLTIIALACRIADRIASLEKTPSTFYAANLLTVAGNVAESQREQTGIGA